MLLGDLVSSKGCDLVRGGFHGLRAPDHPDIVTGVLWVRDCKITNAGAHVALHIKGNGWLWVDETKRKGGGSFTVRQYVRFGIDTTIRGVLDLGYDRDTHIATLWLTPDRAPTVKFTTLGKIDVDAEVAFRWGSLMGEKQIVRSSYGDALPRRDFPWLVEQYLEGHLLLDELITRRIPLEQINDGFADLAAGVGTRTVVEMP
jgi:hypothetical protein